MSDVVKIAAYVPVSQEMLDDRATSPQIWGEIAAELAESLLWMMAGVDRPSRWNRSPFADYRPRLFLR